MGDSVNLPEGTPGPPGPAGGGLSAVVDDPTPRLGGSLDGDGNPIAAVTTYNGVTIEAHAARHRGGGADEIDAVTGSVNGLMIAADKTKLDGIATGATATPLSGATPEVSIASTGAAGASSDASRGDHRHEISVGAPSSIGTANAGGASTAVSRADHVHDHGAQTSQTLHAVATVALNGFMSAADKFKLDNIAGLVLSNTTPEMSIASTGSAGISSEASRGDHRHEVSVGVPVDIGSANAAGSASSLARSDHVHNHANQAGGALHAAVIAAGANGFMTGADKTRLDGMADNATATPLTAAAGANVDATAAIAGVATEAARADHTHQVQAGSPVAVGSANADGTANNFARADHVHSHGNQAGGGLHANATVSVAGFLSATDKVKLDSISANAPLTFVSIVDDFVIGYNGGTWEVGNFGWLRRANGTGNIGSSTDGDADHPGIYQMGCGTAASSLSAIYLAGISSAYLPFQISGGEITITWVVQQNGTLANMARSLFGLGDIFQTNADQSNGVYFEVDSGDTNWHLVANTAGTKTRRDTGVAYVDGNWIQLTFTINAAATSIQANINGTDQGAAITTNIPTSAKLGLLAKTDGNGGVSNICNVDFMQFAQTRTNNRYD